MSDYNIGNIAKLLNKALGDDDLMGFCQSDFEEVFERFGAGQNKQQKILMLIDYCKRNLLIDKLLKLLQKKNPAQYRANSPYKNFESIGKSVNKEIFRGGSKSIGHNVLPKLGNDRGGSGGGIKSFNKEIFRRGGKSIRSDKRQLGTGDDYGIGGGIIREELPNKMTIVKKGHEAIVRINNAGKNTLQPVKSQKKPEPARGYVWYRIPKKMQKNTDHRCQIRIAYNKEIIISDLQKNVNDILKENVPVTNSMEVIIIENPNFRITAINDAFQIIEKDIFTEWNFNVTPLRLGNFTLTFRISAVFYENNGIIKKQVVLDEKVEIVSYHVDDALTELKITEIDLENSQEEINYSDNNNSKTNEMSLKEKLNDLLASNKVKEALDLLLEMTRQNDTETYNTLILLKGRYTSNESDNSVGIVSRDEYLRTKAQIIHGTQQVIKDIPLFKNLLDRFKKNKNGMDEKNDELKQKILFLAADPSDQARLEIDREYREIKKQIQLGKNRDSFEFLMPELALTINELLRAMNQKPAIVHFTGHGEKDGIIITNSANETMPMPTKALQRLFKQHKETIRLVFLSSCYSSKQAKIISALGFYVIGMNTAVEDLAAQSFATGLYNGLGEGKEIEKAYDDAMIQLEAEFPDSAKIPVIWKDGVKLDL